MKIIVNIFHGQEFIIQNNFQEKYLTDRYLSKTKDSFHRSERSGQYGTIDFYSSQGDQSVHYVSIYHHCSALSSASKVYVFSFQEFRDFSSRPDLCQSILSINYALDRSHLHLKRPLFGWFALPRLKLKSTYFLHVNEKITQKSCKICN